MYIKAEISQFLWTKAINIIAFLLNWTPINSNLGINLYQRILKKKNQLLISFTYLLSKFTYLLTKKIYNRLDPKAIEEILVDYEKETKRFCYYISKHYKLKITCNVFFDETIYYLAAT